MATVSHSPLDSLRSWHSLENHPVWASSFPSSEQENLVRDDLKAGFGVAGLLVAVVTLGLLLIAGSVALIVL
jgi:hypothetical protein